VLKLSPPRLRACSPPREKRGGGRVSCAGRGNQYRQEQPSSARAGKKAHVSPQKKKGESNLLSFLLEKEIEGKKKKKEKGLAVFIAFAGGRLSRRGEVGVTIFSIS